MRYTLLVIDMQSEFQASNNRTTISACIVQIKEAIKNDCPIIFAEFVGFGPTHKRLTNLVKNYKHTYTILKNRESAAPEFELALIHFKCPKNIRVCGVNTDQCVLSTVKDLSSTHFLVREIEIVKDACNTDTETGTKRNEAGLHAMSVLPGVRII